MLALLKVARGYLKFETFSDHNEKYECTKETAFFLLERDGEEIKYKSLNYTCFLVHSKHMIF